MKVKYLKELIRPVNILETFNALPETRVQHICYDSRKVNTGSLFVAIRGFKSDGHQYLAQVQKSGAVAAIVESIDPGIPLPQYRVTDSRQALASLSATFFSPEIEQMRLVGITGTNGKTTTSYLIRAIMDSAGIRSGLIGTIAYITGDKNIKAWNTTPESADLFEMLYRMYQKNLKGCVIEVSSHGLQLHRVDHLQFEVAVFTNLTQDHLDFHRDMEHYFKAKSILFEHIAPGGHAVINADDPYGQRLIARHKQNTISFAIHNNAPVTARDWKSSLNGTHVIVDTPVGKKEIRSPLIGEFNIENILAAVTAGLAMNFDLGTIVRGIESVPSVPGRLEPVKIKGKKIVVVDYAHTPDALQKSLTVLRKLGPNRVWVVFGCGGDRDKAKRPLMGKIATDHADFVIVTSDNPRSEDPERIIQDILAGIFDHENIMIEPDRRRAIQYALTYANETDTILIAGKGHEDYQEIAGVRHPFDDRTVVRELGG